MMMKEISLHILDIAENSVSANASIIEIFVTENTAADLLTVEITDNGKGMDEETVKRVVDPFVTSRTTRKVGLGIPMFKVGAEMCDGSFELHSAVGRGTDVKATYRLSHLDRPPLGNMGETIIALVACNPNVDFVYKYAVDSRVFLFDTREVRSAIGPEIPLNYPEIIAWMRSCLIEGIQELNGGA